LPESFDTNFTHTGQNLDSRVWSYPALASVTGYARLADEARGATYDDGLYRFCDSDSGPMLLGLLTTMFPDFAQRGTPFGFDWLGRIFAIDIRRTEHGEPLVLLMDSGAGEALEIPLTFAQFHDQLDSLREPALAAGFFDRWANADPTSVPLPYGACIGYRVPLFLGGKDDVDNLEVTDLDVYWKLNAQLRSATKNEALGRRVHGVSRD
jgi:hypothetical protein